MYVCRDDADWASPLTSFRPVNDDHAVTSVAFQLRLDEFVEPPTLQAAATEGAWRATLPAVLPTPPATAIIQGQPVELPATQFAVVRPDARPVWALRFAGFEVTVECHAYTRWASVWEQAYLYLDQAFTLIRAHQSDTHVLEVRLQVGDRFLSDASDYDGAQLFNAGGAIGDHFLSQRGAWHSNAGWFETPDDLRVLNALNIQASGERKPGATSVSSYAFTVSHRQAAALPGGGTIPWERVKGIIEGLHDRNKQELRKLLKNEMLTRIGLNT